MFCRFCEHSIDFSRIGSEKDHLKSKKHSTKKCSKLKLKETECSSLFSTSRQVTFSSIVKSKDLREDFALDNIKPCTLADIPLHMTEKMWPFLKKHSRQAGCMPQALRKVYVPRLFEKHYSAHAEVFTSQHVSIAADETTDVRDHLNAIASVRGTPYFCGVVHLEACNHCTFS